MAKAKTAPAPQRSAPAVVEKRRRMAFLRRLTRHSIFGLHVIVFILGSIFIWSLPASQPDQQFDSLTWLVILCAHGMLAYRRSKVAFVFHLLMYSAGNAAIWNIFTDTPTKIALTAGWTLLIALIGLWLYRRLIPQRELAMPMPVPKTKAVPAPAPAPARAPKQKAKRQPEPEPEPEPEYEYEPEAYEEEEEPTYEESVYYEPVEDPDQYAEEEHYLEYPQEMPDGSPEPALDPDDTPVPKRRRKTRRD